MNKELLYERKNAYPSRSEEEKTAISDFCEDYKKAISDAKTEREFCALSVAVLEKAGFKSIDSYSSLKSGDKVYAVNREKGIMAAVIGRKAMREGTAIVGAHIDSPRLDLKPNPLFEEGGMAYFKTHYYGGIRKYHWYNIPLALHGVVVKKDGERVEIKIGEDENDPIFTIPDLLPHLAAAYSQKKLSEAFDAEKLNAIIGNIESDDEDAKEKIKYGIMKLLNDKYGICEADLMSSELELVPALNARDLGLDRSMIAAYGQDDRVCAYTALRAVADTASPEKTAVMLLVDKEEIGSMGTTGMQSRFFENTIAKLCYMTDNNYNDIVLRDCLSNSVCLSADVGAAYDMNFAETAEKRNCPIVNGGLLLTKYTGARGKSGSSDASAELVAKIRGIFEDNDVAWQSGELGRIDVGGGGTIAQFVANLDVDTIDAGVPLLGMHSPYEVAGKLDVYMAYKGYKAFMNS